MDLSPRKPAHVSRFLCPREKDETRDTLLGIETEFIKNEKALLKWKYTREQRKKPRVKE